jgi:cobalt/nickel transport system permease protein
MDSRFALPEDRIPSPISRFDARVKIITVLALIVAIASAPRDDWWSPAVSLAVLAALAAACRVPAGGILRRAVLASPFVVMAAVMIPLSRGGAETVWPASQSWRQALALALKAYASILALSLLVLTERMGRLTGAMRSLGLPAAVGSALSIAGSFLGILGEEAVRMKRARESRTPGPLRVSRIAVVGRTAAHLFLRGLDRSKKVQAAMASRGFSGSFPDSERSRIRCRDLLAAATWLVPFVAIRLALS